MCRRDKTPPAEATDEQTRQTNRTWLSRNAAACTSRCQPRINNNNNNNNNNNKHIYKAPCMPTEGHRGTGEVLVRRSGDSN